MRGLNAIGGKRMILLLILIVMFVVYMSTFKDDFKQEDAEIVTISVIVLGLIVFLLSII